MLITVSGGSISNFVSSNWCHTQISHFVIIWGLMSKCCKWAVRSKLIWEIRLNIVYGDSVCKQENMYPWVVYKETISHTFLGLQVITLYEVNQLIFFQKGWLDIICHWDHILLWIFGHFDTWFIALNHLSSAQGYFCVLLSHYQAIVIGEALLPLSQLYVNHDIDSICHNCFICTFIYTPTS